MKPKQIMKIIVDAAMTVLLLLLMTYERIGSDVHEWFGISVFMLFVLHHILDYTRIKDTLFYPIWSIMFKQFSLDFDFLENFL